MSDKQTSRPEEDALPGVRDDESTHEKSEAPISYYYDDATGYEIYEEENDDDEEKPNG